MEKQIIKKSSLGYRVWRFTHWWRDDDDRMLRQTNTCKYFWRLALMPVPAGLLWILWEALKLAVWVVVSVLTVASARGIFTPHFWRWVEFPQVVLVKTTRRQFTLSGVLQGIIIFAILVGVIGLLVTNLGEVSWGGFWEGFKSFLAFIATMFVLGAIWVFFSWLNKTVTDRIRQHKERVCRIITFE